LTARRQLFDAAKETRHNRRPPSRHRSERYSGKSGYRKLTGKMRVDIRRLEFTGLRNIDA
jgi:hypothetical protein